MTVASDANGSRETISGNNMTLDALGIKDYDVTKNFDLKDVDKALDKVSSARSETGAKTNAVDYALSYNSHAALELDGFQMDKEERNSDMGVPVFLADVKGDLSGMVCEGTDSEDMQKRIQKFGLAEAGFKYQKYPATFWDVFGEKGIPLRTTVSEMGPICLPRQHMPFSHGGVCSKRYDKEAWT